MLRTVKPEILDQLAQGDPAIPHARRDLLFINTLMGNHRWMIRHLKALVRPGDAILELGGGDGRLARSIASLKSLARGISMTVVDLAPPPDDWPPDHKWIQGDLCQPGAIPPATDITVANLILHHFDHDQLAAIGEQIRRISRIIVASEPVRRPIHQKQVRLLGFFGLHPVTRHDAHVSIAAGFRGRELPEALGLTEPDWRVKIKETPLGAYRLLAVRR